MRPRHALSILALVCATASSGCLNPVALSPECKRTISECLADCPDPPERPDRADSDERTDCERRCHGLCTN